MAARKIKSPAWLYREAEQGGIHSVALPEDEAGAAAAAAESEPAQPGPLEAAEPVLPTSEGAARGEAHAEPAPLPDEPEADAMVASAAGVSDTADDESSVAPGSMVMGEPVADAATGPGQLEAGQDEPSAAMPAAPDGPATHAAPQPPNGPEIPTAPLPDRAELAALLANVRESRAAFAADVHALTEGLERYVRGHLLAEDGEVGRLRRQLARAERARDEVARERDELAQQLREAREGQAGLVAVLRQVREAIEEQTAALSAPDREVPPRPGAERVPADLD